MEPGGVESDSEFSTRGDQEHGQAISWLGDGGAGGGKELPCVYEGEVGLQGACV